MKKLLLTASLFLVTSIMFAQNSAKVFYIPLSDNATYTANPIKEYPQSDIAENRGKIKVYPEIKHQVLSGIGGCFNEIGGEALSHLDKNAQKEVLNALFNNENGGNMEYCRMSVGASDFGIDAYSFSETEGDYQMKNFSMKREKQYMMPFIKKAVVTKPDIKIFGSPWSPPAWMKHSKYMDRGVEFPEENTLIDSPEIYKAYALYFAKYVEAYKKEGIIIDRICIQNEQDLNTKYPSCKMPVEQMAKFVQNYMKPLFDERNIETDIWGGTFRTYGLLEGIKFASDESLMKDFGGIGIQYTNPIYINDIKKLAPGLRIMHTESNCHDGKNSVAQARSRFSEVASYINGGSENFAYWNMILNETGKSGWDWRQNALITINRDTKEITYNPDYAVMNFLSKFIRPNSVRVSSFCTSETITVAYNGKYYVIMQNNGEKPLSFDCDVNDNIVKAVVPAKSLSVIVL